ncbi:unnamed protein product [Effrenium voratum]|nr:unnamed protein product [Effrenium voratum]
MDPLYTPAATTAVDDGLEQPRSAGRMPVALTAGREASPPRLPGARPPIDPMLSGSLPPPVSSRWADRSVARVAPPKGIVVPSVASDLSTAGDLSSLSPEQEQQLEMEIRLLEQQLANADGFQEPHVLPDSEEARPPATPPRIEVKLDPSAFVSDYAHLTRSEYIKLKAQRRDAALAIQTQIKVFLVRRYMCVARRVPSLRRIQASCRCFLAQAEMKERRMNQQLKFVLLMTQLQAKIRLRLKRKRMEKQRQQDEEERLWHAALRKLQGEAAVKVASKCRSFLAGALLAAGRTPQSVKEIQRMCRVHFARVHLVQRRMLHGAARRVQLACQVHLSRRQVLDQLALVREQERLRIRAVLRLQTLLKGMRARQELHHLRVLNDGGGATCKIPWATSREFSETQAGNSEAMVASHGLVFGRGSAMKALAWSLPASALTVLLHQWLDADLGQQLEGCEMIWLGFSVVLGVLVALRSYHAYTHFCERASTLHQVSNEWGIALTKLLSFCNCAVGTRTSDWGHGSSRLLQHLLTRLMSLLHSTALAQCCGLEDGVLEVLDLSCINKESLAQLKNTSDQCETLLLWLERCILEAERQKVLDVPAPILSSALQQLSHGMLGVLNFRSRSGSAGEFVECEGEIQLPGLFWQVLSFGLTAHWLLTPVASQLLRPWLAARSPGVGPHNMQKQFNEKLQRLTLPQSHAFPDFKKLLDPEPMASPPSLHSYFLDQDASSSLPPSVRPSVVPSTPPSQPPSQPLSGGAMPSLELDLTEDCTDTEHDTVLLADELTLYEIQEANNNIELRWKHSLNNKQLDKKLDKQLDQAVQLKITLIDDRGIGKPEKFTGKDEEHFLRWKIKLEEFIFSIFPSSESRAEDAVSTEKECRYLEFYMKKMNIQGEIAMQGYSSQDENLGQGVDTENLVGGGVEAEVTEMADDKMKVKKGIPEEEAVVMSKPTADIFKKRKKKTYSLNFQKCIFERPLERGVKINSEEWLMQLHDGMTQMDQDLLDALQEAQASRTGRHVWVADGNLCPQSRSGRESRLNADPPERQAEPMIEYKHGTWGMAVLARRRGSALVWSLPCALITVLLHSFWDTEKGEANREMEGITTIWSSFTFVLGFLIVFRSNQAYSRFWESVTLFQQTSGEWTSALSNLLSFCRAEAEYKDDVEKFRQYLIRLLSLLHCNALQTMCELDDDSLEILNLNGISERSLQHLSRSPDRCETVLLWIERLIIEANNKELFDVPPPILSRAFQELSRGMVGVTNVRKIRMIPFPFPYSQYLSLMLIAHWILTPFVASQLVLKAWWAGIIVFVVSTSFWTLFYIAQEIDQPFGEDANDLPVRDMQKEFNMKLEYFVKPLSFTLPDYTFTAERLPVQVLSSSTFKLDGSLSLGEPSEELLSPRPEIHVASFEQPDDATLAAELCLKELRLLIRDLVPHGEEVWEELEERQIVRSPLSTSRRNPPDDPPERISPRQLLVRLDDFLARHGRSDLDFVQIRLLRAVLSDRLQRLKRI